MFGKDRGIVSLLEYGAVLTENQFNTEYSNATMAIRELSTHQALEKLSELEQSIPNISGADTSQQFTEFGRQIYQNLYAQIGFDFEQDSQQLMKIEQDLHKLTRIFRHGDLSSRFWHWMDRFYYEWYQPWRIGQQDRMRIMKSRAENALEKQKERLDPGLLSWLPSINPLSFNQNLQEAVRTGKIKVYFWVEPFGLVDSWTLMPGVLLISFAESGPVFENFIAFSEAVASRTKALADPTRLLILRMIRHFGLINTEIATMLGISRPTVSVHAKILREAGLIRSRQEGRLVRHEIVPEVINELFHDLQKLLDIQLKDKDDNL